MNPLDNLFYALENANELFTFCEQTYNDKRIKELRKRYKEIIIEIRNINNELKEKEEAVDHSFIDKEIFRVGINK